MASRELTTSRFGGSAGLATMDAYKSQLRNVQMQVNADNSRDILRCDKDTGVWTFGQENIPLDNAELAINPLSFKHGYIAFDDKGSIAVDCYDEPCSIFVALTTPLPRMENLPEIDQPKRGKPAEWRLQMGFDALIITGPHKGAELVYKPTSHGGLKMVSKLSAEILRRWDSELNDIVPVVELFSGSYNKKTHGKIITPEAEILAWIEFDDDALELAAPATEPEKHPKRGETTAKGRAVDERKTATRKTSIAKARVEEPEEDDGDAEDEAPARGKGRVSREEPEDEEPVTRTRGRGRGRAAKREEPEDGEPARRSSRSRDEDEAPARAR